jgi:hypothetical protein
MAERKELIARIRAELKRQEAQTEKFAGDLGIFLRRNISRLLRRLEDGKVSAQEAARILGSLESKLDELGLSKQISKVTQLHLDEVDSALDTLKLTTGKAAVTLSAVDAANLQSVIEFDTEVIANKVTTYLGDLKPIMMRSIYGGEKVEVDKILDGEEPTLIRQIQTEVDTALKAFSQTVTNKKAKDLGFEYFEYLGPDDEEVTRDFCQQVLEGTYPELEREQPIYSTEEIESMENGQDLPVRDYRGGYNCRHSWQPVSTKQAEEALAEDEGD